MAAKPKGKAKVKSKYKTVRYAKDNSELILIPGGDFLMGSEENDLDSETREKPGENLLK